MNVIIKEPCEEPFEISIPNELSTLQELVYGYIETIGLDTDLVLICNEDGKLMGLPRNIRLLDKNGKEVDVVCGTVIVTGVDGDEFDSLTDKQIEYIKNWLNERAIR